jgi:hypothetical protein
MIQAAQSGFGVIVIGLQLGRIQLAIDHCNAGARLARDESVSANPELCQGFQIALVSA